MESWAQKLKELQQQQTEGEAKTPKWEGSADPMLSLLQKHRPYLEDQQMGKMEKDQVQVSRRPQ